MKYMLLPVELTEEMREVLTEMLTKCHSIEESYSDLLNAYPKDVQTQIDYAQEVFRRFKL